MDFTYTCSFIFPYSSFLNNTIPYINQGKKMNNMIPKDLVITALLIAFISSAVGFTFGFKYGEVYGISKEQKKEIRKYKEIIKSIG